MRSTPSAEVNSVMMSPHPPRLRMKRRKTVSVTPAMGARTVAGEIVTLPMVRVDGTGFSDAAWWAKVPAPHELSQNFFTVLFYLSAQSKNPRRSEGLRICENPWRMLLRRRNRGRGRVLLGVFAPEALYTTGGVPQLLLAGEERMAVRADFDADVALMSGAGHKSVAARAMHAHFVVCGMNSWFHRSVQSRFESLDSTGYGGDSATQNRSQLSALRCQSNTLESGVSG